MSPYHLVHAAVKSGFLLIVVVVVPRAERRVPNNLDIQTAFSALRFDRDTSDRMTKPEPTPRPGSRIRSAKKRQCEHVSEHVPVPGVTRSGVEWVQVR